MKPNETVLQDVKTETKKTPQRAGQQHETEEWAEKRHKEVYDYYLYELEVAQEHDDRHYDDRRNDVYNAVKNFFDHYTTDLMDEVQGRGMLKGFAELRKMDLINQKVGAWELEQEVFDDQYKSMVDNYSDYVKSFISFRACDCHGDEQEVDTY